MKGKDLTGMHFGKLTVLEPTKQRVRNAVVWRCRCECGNEILVESRRLKPYTIFSCGCEPSPYEEIKDLTGYHFGKLFVEGRSGNKAKDGNPLWLCQCGMREGNRNNKAEINYRRSEKLRMWEKATSKRLGRETFWGVGPFCLMPAKRRDFISGIANVTVEKN